MTGWLSSLSAGYWIAVGLGSGLSLLMIFVLVQSKTAVGDAQLASPIAGAGIVLLGLLAGLVVDAHSSSFTGAPILRHLKDDAPATLIVFLLLAGGALLLASAYYRAADRIRKREIDDLVQKSDELARTLRTLPPESFLSTFADFCAGALEAYEVALAKHNPEVTRQCIRLLLRTLAKAAQLFSRGKASDKFSAHVLVFCEDASWQPRTWATKERSLYPPNHLPEKLRGALVLDPDLTTSASSETAAPNDVKALVIPIPNGSLDAPTRRQPAGGLRVLPGAATAFVTNAFQIYPDTHRLGEIIESLHSLDAAVADECVLYFTKGRGRGIRSFVSFPLHNPDSPEGEPIGVLNIDCGVPEIFGSEARGSVANFRAAVAPILVVLERLLTMHGVLEGPHSPCSGMQSALDSTSTTPEV